MQEKELRILAKLIIEELEKRDKKRDGNQEWRTFYDGLIKSKKTISIRILDDVKVMLVTHCKDRMETPVIYASRAIAKEILNDKKKN